MTNHRSFRGLIALGVCLSLSAYVPSVSLAAPITSVSISGTQSAPSNGSTFTLDHYNSFAFSPSPSPAPSGLGATPVDYTLGTTTVASNIASGSATLDSTFTINANGGSAVFDLVNPSSLTGLNNSPGFGSAVTNTTATLATNTTGLDFGSIGGTWSFTTSISNVNINAGSPGTASFGATVGETVSLTYEFGPGGGGGVPEPHSFVLWSVLGMVGLCIGGRNLRGKLAV